jgi:Zn-dependent peptidase ImmA (M78 family)
MSLFNNLNPIELGERLRIARNNAGITQEVAAQTIQIKRPTLVALEQGKRRIKPEELTELANLYQVSCSSLLRQNSVYIDIKPQFRLTHDQAKKADELIASRTLQKLVSSYVELERKLHKPLRIAYPTEYPLTRGQLSEQAEDLSLQVRHGLGLGLAPISNIMTLLQNELQIRLFIHPLPSKISGMFAYHPELAACIVVNAKHPKTRQAMSAAHELAHFYTRRNIAEVSWIDSDFGDEERVLHERFANLFAMAFLMPAAAIRRSYQDIVREQGQFTARDLLFLKSNFYVSLEAIARRLEDLGILPTGKFELLKERGIYQLSKEILGEDSPECHTLTIPRYILLAVEAYQQEWVTEGQLADMFDLDRVEVRDKIDELSHLFDEIEDVLHA